MINIVIPMAGEGSRFKNVGFTKPKPFIEVLGKPMIEHVISTFDINDAHYILLARDEHMQSEQDTIEAIKKNVSATFIPVTGLTEGAACTVLYAHRLIANNQPLLIINSDQVVDCSLQAYIDDCAKRKLDGSILTFKEPGRDPKWSYARCGDNGLVDEVKEKVAISDEATVGAYFFSRGMTFVESALDMIVRREKSNNEYYVAPTYNYAIRNGAKIGTYCIDSKVMHGIGTPEDLDKYLKLRTACTQ